MASNFNHDLAALFVQDENHLKNLLYSYELDAFYLYQPDQGYFKLFDEKRHDMENYILKFLQQRVTKNISMSLIKDIKSLIKLMTCRKIGYLESKYIALKSQLLDVETFDLLPFSPELITFSTLPFDASELTLPKSDSLWFKFLDEIVVKEDLTPDKELQKTIQEMFGYALLPSSKAEKTFFLVGEGANGKSVLLNVLRNVVGEHNCASKSIESLTTDRFATSGLVGKTLNICSEEESDYIKSDKFKAIVSGEPIDIERKFGEATTGRFSVKFVFATNEMPTFSGFNYGLLRRMVIIPFLKTIEEEKRDVNLIHRLLQELPSIIGWSLEGAKQLSNRNFRFCLTDSSLKKQNEFKENLSSAIMFVNERFQKDSENFISNDDLYTDYVVWCDLRGVKKMKFYRFTKDLGKSFGETFLKRDKETGQVKRGRNLSAKIETLPLTSEEQETITF